MARVFLIGFMGVGKTTLGRRVAEVLGYDFVDLDQAIEDHAGRSVSDLFTEEGEVGFRTRETEQLDRLLLRNNVVIATGGGTPTLRGAMESMKESGIVIWLRASVATILSRTADCTDRPLLEGLDPVERGRKVETMMNLREPIYSRADFTIDTDSQDPGLLADAIYSRLQRHEELT